MVLHTTAVPKVGVGSLNGAKDQIPVWQGAHAGLPAAPTKPDKNWSKMLSRLLGYYYIFISASFNFSVV